MSYVPPTMPAYGTATMVFATSSAYPTIQSAITYAETLAAATTATGVTVVIPSGTYAENLVIRKNISLIGQGTDTAKIDSLTFRPTSIAVGPTNCTIANLIIGDTLAAGLIVRNETATSSGIYLPDGMFNNGSLNIINCHLFSPDFRSCAVVLLRDCVIETAGVLNTIFTNCVAVAGWAIQTSTPIDVNADSTQPDVPSGLSIASRAALSLEGSVILGTITLTKVAGTIPAHLTADTSYLETIDVTSDCELYIYGGSVGTRILTGSGHVIGSYTGSSPFSPTVPTDWTTSPEKVDTALDELAARSASGGVSDGDKGDIVVSSSGSVWTVDTNAITNAKAAQMATKTYKGRTSAATGNAEDVPVATLKTDLSLGNVDNTSDANKPVSTAQQTAIDGKVSDTAYNATSWDAVTTVAPSKNAVRDQVETMLTSISGKEPTITAGTTSQYLRGDKSLSTFATDAKTAAVNDTAYNAGTWDAVTDVAPSKNAVRDQIETMLTSIDAKVSDTAYNAGTWDAVTTIAPSKNAIRDQIETMLTSISGKEPAITAGTTSQYLRGDKSLSTFASDAKTAAVNDTAYNAGTWDAVVDVAPSKNAVRDQIETMLTSISGKEPTITSGTTAQYLRGDKSLATFDTSVRGAVLTGFVSGAATVGATDTVLQAFQKLDGNDALKAPLASPTFTGTPSLPTGTTGITQTAGTSNTTLATTAFVTAQNDTGVYRTLMAVTGSHTAAKVAGTYAFGQGDVIAVGGTGTLYPIQTIYIAAADYPSVGALTAKLRIRAQLYTNDVAPTGNYTFGLYPITRPGTSGAAGLVIYTIGTVVSGSNGATYTTPAADLLGNAVGSDFALPADGPYVLAVVTTGTVAASAHVHMSVVLQMRYS